MVYQRPEVSVFQQLTTSPTLNDNVRRACIIGPNIQLHRFGVAAEKATIGLGAYNHTANTPYSFPGQASGSVIDPASVKLWVENGLLQYFVNEIGDTSGDLGILAPVAGRANWVSHAEMNWKTNGAYTRSVLLGDRDVKLGDVVYIRGVEDPLGLCIEHTMFTTVAGFSTNSLASIIGLASPDASNPNSTVAASAVSFTAGQANCVDAGAITGTYDALTSGLVSETYTIEVVKSSVAGCTAARLKITSASGTDNVGEITPAAFGSPTAIGTRGISLQFDINPGPACTVASTTAGVAPNEFLVGQVWTLTVTGDYVKACPTAGGTYSGPNDDTYIVEVVKGGLWAALPAIRITTATGVDVSGPTVVTNSAVSVPIGSYGVTMSFDICGALGPALTGLRLGDKFAVSVQSSSTGPMRTLILRDNLPTGLLGVTALEIKLFIPKTFEITPQRFGFAPLFNYVPSPPNGINVQNGIRAYHDEWTINGVKQPMLLYSGVTAVSGQKYGNLYLEYGEFLNDVAHGLTVATSLTDINAIPGQLEPGNPLKWGAYKAWQNAGNSGVAYIAVTDPNVLANWSTALSLIEGLDSYYNFVPMSMSLPVQQLCQGQATTESAPEVANWKGSVISVPYVEHKRIVGDTVSLAIVEDDPNAAGTQYTRMTIAGATLLTSNAKAGDQVRFLFTTDGFGGSLYTSYTIASVLSETTCLLTTGTAAAITIPQKVEVWHAMTKDEIVADLIGKAGVFGDTRVVMTLPDVVYEGGQATPGFFASAAVAGLISAVQPHQGLTNANIAGLDGIVTRTRDYFNQTQMDKLGGGGLWIITATRAGVVHTRHALTTDTSDLKHREEMIRRNLDSISYDFVGLLRPYIGRTNATQIVLDRMAYDIDQKLATYKTAIASRNLGPQIIAGEIATDIDGTRMLRIHPLAADRIEITVTLTLPAPGNNINLYLVA